jgi:branched-chain amino acid transport system substrate-binding protein
MNVKGPRRLTAFGGCTAPLLALVLAMIATGAMADNLVIGAVGSLTGAAASFDKAVVDGVRASIKYWNDRGGYNGRQIELRLLDDESQPATAVTIYRRLTDDPAMKAVIAASPSASLVAIKAVADEFRTPTAGSATLEVLAKPPARYFFRTLPSSDAYMTALMNWVKARGYGSIATLNPSDVTGQREALVIRDYAAKAGIKLAAAESYNNSDTSFTAQLVNIRNARPGFVYAGVIGGPTVQIFKQIRQLRLTMPLALHSSAFNDTFYQSIGGKDQAEGVYTPIERGGIGSTAQGSSGDLFKAASDALGHTATNLNTAGFDTGLIMMNAVTKSDGSRDSIRDQLEATRDLQVIGGLVTYSADNHEGKDERSVAVGQLVNGSFVEAR